MTATTELPDKFEDESALEEFMSRPSPALIRDLEDVEGDIIVVGVAGKMGPTLARMAKRAVRWCARLRLSDRVESLHGEETRYQRPLLRR